MKRKPVGTKPGLVSFATRLAVVALFSVFIANHQGMAGPILSGHVPGVIRAGLKPIARVPGTNTLHLNIALPLRNKETLTSLLGQIYNPASPYYHRYLTRDQFTDAFGPTEDDYDTVAAFAKTNGLSVTGTHANRKLLEVTGTVSDIEKVFHIRLGIYQHPTEKRTFFAPDTDPSPDVSVPLEHIDGLDNYTRAVSFAKATPLGKAAKSFGYNTGSAPFGIYESADFRGAYAPGSKLNGTGQSVALVELDGYTPSDIVQYEISNNIPTNTITITNILLGGFNGLPSSTNNDSTEIEVSLDIEMAIAMATNLSKVLVYEATNVNGMGNFNEVLNQIASDDLAKQVSSSWGAPYVYPYAYPPDNPVGDEAFMEMAAQGQGIFQASGDLGALFPVFDGPFPFPTDNPYVVTVGGTDLNTTGPGGAWLSEMVWYQPLDYFSGSSGGGISQTYAIPAWQANVSMSTNFGSTTMRNTPDIAAIAYAVYVRVDGQDDFVEGTSCAAPLMAGYEALLNQQAAANGRAPLGFAAPALYAVAQGTNYASCFHDTTNGNNALSSTAFGFQKYYATNGYDLCTGWGSPGSNLLTALLAADAGYSLGANTRLEGPAAGRDSVVLAVSPNSGPWTIETNAIFLPSWLHVISVPTGTGSTNVIFSFDPNTYDENNTNPIYPLANPGTTRTATITIAGQTLTVTQAGQAYVPTALVTNLVTSGLLGSNGVAVDSLGNVYIADSGNNEIQKWTPTNNSVSVLVPPSAGLSHPYGVAVDILGDVFIADTGNNAIKKLPSGGGSLTTLISSGLSQPASVAVDNSGNVLIADSGHNQIKELSTNNTVVTVVSGLNNPVGVAVDAADNLYVADGGDNTVYEWNAATSNLTTLVTGFNGPTAVTVDNGGNVYIADGGNNAIKEWVAASNLVSVLVSSGLNHPAGVAVDAAGNVYIADSGNNAIKERPYAFLNPSPVLETAEGGQENPAGGNDTFPVVLPATANLSGPFTPVSNQPWLTITGTNNGILSFNFTPNNTGIFGRTAQIAILGHSITVNQASPYTIGATSYLVSPATGSNTIVLGVNPLSFAWTNTANNTWLHLGAASQTGTGSTNLVFSYDANPGSTRVGTLTVQGVTVTVTQAGTGYLQATMATNIVSIGLSRPEGVAVDGAGDVYIADTGNNAIKKWTPTNNLVTTLLSWNSGLLLSDEPYQPDALALDNSNNVFISDNGDNQIVELNAADNAASIMAPFPALLGPSGVAVDGMRNLYIANDQYDVIRELPPGSTNLATIPLNQEGAAIIYSVAVDAAGNLYFPNDYDGPSSIQKWTAANSNVTTLVSQSYGLSAPFGVAVDGAGNVYIADTFNSAIEKWTAVNGTTAVLVSSNAAQLDETPGVAVDKAGNVYIANEASNRIVEFPYAYVNPSPKNEPLGAGTDSLPPVLPATAPLSGPFAPISDQSWVTITGTTGGVVTFSYAANNTAAGRVAHINVLGQIITVTQVSPYSLGAASRLEGPATGSDSVVLAVSPDFPNWTATANTNWLHLSAANQSGTGSTNVIFSFDANGGGTRTGTINLSGLTLTITQAGSNYVTADIVGALVNSGLAGSNGVAVDNSGNIYIADSGNNEIQEWFPTNNSLSVLVPSSAGLNHPLGVAVDNSGDVYIADTGNNAIKELPAGSGNLITNVSSGLNGPSGVAVDVLGDLFIADTGNNAIKELPAGSSTVSTVISSGLSHPNGIAVDGAGNLYIADTGHNAVEKWVAANSSLNSLVSGLNKPSGVAVDGGGNVYLADTGNNAIKEWVAASNLLGVVVSSGLNSPVSVAVDSGDNVYLADSGNNAVKEFPYAFLVPTPRPEGSTAGSDALPVVVPATANLTGPFAPTSNQSWLTINGVAGGVVAFSFTADDGSNRVADIGLLGQSIPVSQSFAYSLNISALLEGPSAGADSVLLTENPNVGPWTNTANATWLHLSASNQTGSGSARIIFTYDNNTGATRAGTLTIQNLTVTVTQAGSTYVAAGVVTNLAPGLTVPYGVAVDNSNNVYIADTDGDDIKKWSPTNNMVTTLVAATAGLNSPYSVAVDNAGDVYIADSDDNQIKELLAGSGTLITNISSGLDVPLALAVDNADNLYIADTFHSAIKKWTATNGNVTTLTAGYEPHGVGVDSLGNVAFSDYEGFLLQWLAANSNTISLVSSGLSGFTWGVAADSSGNVFVSDTFRIEKWNPANSNATVVVPIGTLFPYGLAVDSADDVYIAAPFANQVDELPHAFVDTTSKMEPITGASDVLPTVIPASENLTGPFAPISNQPWLTFGSINNGVVNFSVIANPGPPRNAQIGLLGQTITVNQAGSTYSLATGSRLEGQSAGSDSVVLSVSSNLGQWTATTNAAWLHLSAANQSGAGSANVIFTFDANPGPPRAGTLTIAGQALTVTQAGTNYVESGLVTNLASGVSNNLTGVAVDSSGNVYFAITGSNAVKEWIVASNSVTSRISSGLNGPWGLAVDASGNIYLADSTNNAIKEWMAANSNVTTLVSGLSDPVGMAVDGAGNLYFANSAANTIVEWSAIGNSTTILVSGLNHPSGVAVDGAGNVYFADSGNNAIKEWTAANSNVTVLVSSGLNNPAGVAVDGGGNVYFADNGNNAIKEWMAAGNDVTTLAAGLNHPTGVAVDNANNVYFADSGNNAIKEWVYAFVDTAANSELASAGNDVLPIVVPASANLTGPFAPVTDEPWLTITGVTNGVVSFSFGINETGLGRTGHIDLLGQAIPILQGGSTYALGAASRLEGPSAGSDSVILAVTPNNGAWTAAANTNWLHLNAANQAGTGSTNLIFAFDANPGGTRTGTITIEGLTLNVTQAGAGYVADNLATNIVSSLSNPTAVTVDGSGNVYFPSANYALEEWEVSNDNVNGLNFGLNDPMGLASDATGDIYIADTGANEILEYAQNGGGINILVSGLNQPTGIALDASGNLYFSDTGNGEIKKRAASGGSVTILVSGLSHPTGVAVDAADNVYFADSSSDKVYELSPGSGTANVLVSGLNGPYGVAVDGAGNVYIADTGNNAVKEWVAATGIVTNLVTGLNAPEGVAVDTANNLYIANAGGGSIEELPLAFVNTAPRAESVAGGSDSLPVVLPVNANLNGPFAPASDQPWLTITGVANGVVSFTFNPNTTSSFLTAHIALLGNLITVTEASPYALGADMRVEGPNGGNDSIVLATGSIYTNWTATATTNWLHVRPGSQSGSGSTNVYFSYDYNSGDTRSGTFTIAGLTLTIVQAGSSYIPAGTVTPLVSSGLNQPGGVAVDTSGNVFIADTYNDAIKKWAPAGNSVSIVVPASAGLYYPNAVAVDSADNLYIADTYNDAIEEWPVTNNALNILITGLNDPMGVAVDTFDNVDIADTYNYAIEEWSAGNFFTLFNSGLNEPSGVAVDIAGNVYIGDTYNYAIEELTPATSAFTTLYNAPGQIQPTGIAVDGAGNVYSANPALNAIGEWSPANNSFTSLVSGESGPNGVAVDSVGNVYIADTGNNAVEELPNVYINPNGNYENYTAGSDVLPMVVPCTANLSGPFAPASDSPRLTITGTANGVVSYSFTANNGPTRTAYINLFGQSVPITQFSPNNYNLGTYSCLEGPAAGTDSVVLAVSPNTGTWTASVSDIWLHMNLTYQSGTGGTNVVFSFDANPGPTRYASITIAGIPINITQAGSNYVAANFVTNLVSSGLNTPRGVAVDSAGNVFFADSANNAIKEWIPANNAVSNLVSSGLNSPWGVAVDYADDIYFADTGHNLIKERIAANGGVSNLVAGLNDPVGVAVDGNGNLFYANSGADAIGELPYSGGNPTNVMSGLANIPLGLAVDVAENLYFSNNGNKVEEWLAANGSLATLINSGLNGPAGVCVDGGGNVYVADTTNNAVRKWTAYSGTVTALAPGGLGAPSGVAVDTTGNLYFANARSNSIQEWTYAFVATTPKMETGAAGGDTLPAVLPYSENLTGPFTPTSDQPWLTINGVSGGVVAFSFSANVGPNRTAHIIVLGQAIPIIQSGPSYTLGVNARVEGPAAGKDSVVLAVVPNIATWTATTNASWLHLSAANQSGVGSTNVIFSFDANTGATRTGTLTIGGQTLTVTQAGAPYVAANAVATLATAGLSYPSGIGVDVYGNVYFANSATYGVYEWLVASNSYSDLYGIYNPMGIATGSGGEVIFASQNTVSALTVTNGTVISISTFAYSGLNFPNGVAVDSAGNVYIADSGNAAIKEWIAATGSLTNLISSGLTVPMGVAVDAAGNLYIADNSANAIYKWTFASQSLTTLISSGLNGPAAVAVDGAGNVYIADTRNNAVKEWIAASNTVTTLVSGLNAPGGVAVDTTGNVYFTDSGSNAVKELTIAFVNPSALMESMPAGSDVLPVVLPTMENLNAPFAPMSSQSWLTITGVANGVVSFSFTANTTGASRPANISLLGENIPVTQTTGAAPPTSPILVDTRLLANRTLEFSFTDNPADGYTVLYATNVLTPFTNWLVAGTATNINSDVFQFTIGPLTNSSKVFFRVRSP